MVEKLFSIDVVSEKSGEIWADASSRGYVNHFPSFCLLNNVFHICLLLFFITRFFLFFITFLFSSSQFFSQNKKDMMMTHTQWWKYSETKNFYFGISGQEVLAPSAIVQTAFHQYLWTWLQFRRIPYSVHKNKNYNDWTWFSKTCDEFRLAKILAHLNYLWNPTPANIRQLSEPKQYFNNSMIDKVLFEPNDS